MQRLILPFFLYLLSTANLTAGDIYQKGTLTLILDDTFAQGIDWSKLFSANLSNPPKPQMRAHESIALAPDNTIYVVEYNNMTTGNLFKFDAGGKLQSKSPDSTGKTNASLWARHPQLAAVNNQNEIWISEYGGLARCDRQGHVLARTKLDYSISDLVSLNNGALMISSSVISNKPSNPFKLSIILMNTQNAKETLIASYYQNPFTIPMQIGYEPAKGTVGSILLIGMPSKNAKLVISSAPNGNLIAGYSDSPEILIFSPEGRKIGGFALPIERPALSPELKAQAMKRISQNLDSLAASNKVAPDEIERAREKLKGYPTALPYYSNLITDDQGNILVFIADPDNSAKVEFMAFSQSGKFLGKCRFIPPQGVSLRVDGRKQMVIRNGRLYALILKAISGKKQVQLARFKFE
jgi:hypothetical protein